MDRDCRFFVDQPDAAGSAALSPADAHHLRGVLRVQIGDTITAVSRTDGRTFRARVERLEPSVVVRIVEELLAPAGRSNVGSAIVALLKGDRTDLAVEKCTELGVERIVVWPAEHGVVQLRTPADVATRRARLERVAEAAAKQCSRATVPAVHLAAALAALPGLWSLEPGDSPLVCSLAEGSPGIWTLPPRPGRVHVAVGPEGGLTEAEERWFVEQGFTAVSLGPYRLRAETAIIAAVAMAHGRFGYR
jgi:16S rRNA (uracil1498-N3)-methyltransferase